MSEIEREIASQPDLWRGAAARALAFEARLPPRGARVAVVGCGTSLHMAQAIAALRESSGQGETDAFSASEAPPRRSYDCILALSRSGTTTEVLRLLQALPVGLPTLAISAVAESLLVRAAGRSIVLGFADERSIVQTRFATTVLALFRVHLGADIEPIASQAEGALSEELPIDPTEFEHYVFLGRSWTVGLANEAALKLREAAGAWTESYPAMEYRHGPISVAGPNTCVWVLGEGDADLLEDVVKTGATIIANGRDPMAELILVQRTAVALAEAKGLDPEHPRHLTRSVVLS